MAAVRAQNRFLQVVRDVRTQFISPAMRYRFISTSSNVPQKVVYRNDGVRIGQTIDAPIGRGRVPAAIWSRIGTNLHLQDGHPLCTLRMAIETYFESTTPGIFSFHNNLSPIVSAEACFDSLCVPKDHVSRASSDTYYINDDKAHLLRAHMTAHDVDLLRDGCSAFVNCGDVYRRDTVDRTHYPVFHQVDGLRLYGKDSGMNVEKNLKHTLEGLIRAIFGKVEMRWVDAYFPFTEPSWELEMKWKGEWLEVLGCGKVRRQVLTNGNIGEDVSGWAFGLGLERLAMVLFSIPDIRLFWCNDERFLGQFAKRNLDVEYKEFSKYPKIEKDVSFWINDTQEKFDINSVHEIARNISAGDLVENVSVVDRFAKNDRESLCVRFTFRSMQRNLTHDEVNSMFEGLKSNLANTLSIEIR